MKKGISLREEENSTETGTWVTVPIHASFYGWPCSNDPDARVPCFPIPTVLPVPSLPLCYPFVLIRPEGWLSVRAVAMSTPSCREGIHRTE